MSNLQKNRILLIGFCVFVYIAYTFAISKTVELRKQYKQLKEEKNLLSNASVRIFTLQRENKYLDSILQKKEISIAHTFQQTLFQKINQLASENNIEIISFEEPHQHKENGAKVETYIFQVKGNFREMLQLSNGLESAQLGTLVSLNIEKKKNYTKNKEELLAKFYLQKLSQTK